MQTRHCIHNKNKQIFNKCEEVHLSVSQDWFLRMLRTLKKKKLLRGMSDMIHWEKTLAAKAKKLEFDPRTHVVGGENQFLQVVL